MSNLLNYVTKQTEITAKGIQVLTVYVEIITRLISVWNMIISTCQ